MKSIKRPRNLNNHIVWIYWIVLPLSILQDKVCNKIREDLRYDCGPSNITQAECVKRDCCYNETNNGTCFDPKSKFIYLI